MKFRTWIKKTVIGRLVWRIIIGFIGGAVLAGLGILATEFAWAARVMARTRTYAQKAADKAGIPKWAQLAMIAVGAVISIIVILYFYSTGKL
jgi:predicted membrane-bound mannosyltransferase